MTTRYITHDYWCVTSSRRPCQMLLFVEKRFSFYGHTIQFKNHGPVVQSVVSLTSSLRVISLTVLADSIYNIMIFFAEKM